MIGDEFEGTGEMKKDSPVPSKQMSELFRLFLMIRLGSENKEAGADYLQPQRSTLSA